MATHNTSFIEAKAKYRNFAYVTAQFLNKSEFPLLPISNRFKSLTKENDPSDNNQQCYFPRPKPYHKSPPQLHKQDITRPLVTNQQDKSSTSRNPIINPYAPQPHRLNNNAYSKNSPDTIKNAIVSFCSDLDMVIKTQKNFNSDKLSNFLSSYLKSNKNGYDIQSNAMEYSLH